MMTEVTGCAQNHETAEAYRLKRMIVAHDASPASQKALNDAVALARRFQADVLIAHVQSPDELPWADEMGPSRAQRRDIEAEVGTLSARLESGGVRSRAIIRSGAVGDTLFNLCCDEAADLLLMGAYGRGSQDRQTLGSTAEQLLRAVPCPVLTYGPNASSSVISAEHLGPALLPVSLPSSYAQLNRAIALAKLFGEPIEVFHAADRTEHRDMRWFESQCREVAQYIRERGVKTEWLFMYNEAYRAIVSKGLELDSPVIIMPLKWRRGLSAATSDNVAAHVIRQSSVPVLSYRCD